MGVLLGHVVRISPLSRLTMAPTLSFTAKENGSSLEIAVISCTDLPDKDLAGIGFGNKSDPYVKVKVSGYENQTKVADSLNPSYELKSSTFLFPVEDDLSKLESCELGIFLYIRTVSLVVIVKFSHNY